ncbi:hypothetical protein ZEAMMB73_Zm00001d021264 [Zea mays]|uniref:Uncharacterized protein n=1 Tax=Zea mays TaxID=4577 RepID=A0A1D6I9E8_MAIZE|nr:hypothetical protein ZEAMMB73_Zm00001d021264 [Zea mays]
MGHGCWSGDSGDGSMRCCGSDASVFTSAAAPWSACSSPVSSSSRIRFMPIETPNSLEAWSGSASATRPAAAVARPGHAGISSRIAGGRGGGAGTASDDSPEQLTTEESAAEASSCWEEAYLVMRSKMLLQSFFICPSSRVSRAFSRRRRSFSSPVSPDADALTEPEAAACGWSSADPELEERTCSSVESDGEAGRTGRAMGIGAAATVTAPDAAAAAAVASPAAGAGATFRRCMSQSRRFSPRRKKSLANSHRSGTIFLNPYVLSCRTKLEKLLCLKYLGRRSRANSAGRHTTNVEPSSFHEITSSTAGSSTSWYVLVRNGVGRDLCPAASAASAGAGAGAVAGAGAGGSLPAASPAAPPCSAIRPAPQPGWI